MQCSAAAQVKLKPRTAWRDGTHLVMSPLEFTQWLTVMV